MKIQKPSKVDNWRSPSARSQAADGSPAGTLGARSLVEDRATQAKLQAIAARVARRLISREDLFQEALLHLWWAEHEHPGRALLWYLRGCKFHLLHIVNAGVSLDSPRHFWSRVPLPSGSDEEDGPPEPILLAAMDAMSEICAHDEFNALQQRLGPAPRRVLGLLYDGLSQKEIAQEMGISQPAVAKRRKKLGELARRLGVGR